MDRFVALLWFVVAVAAGCATASPYAYDAPGASKAVVAVGPETASGLGVGASDDARLVYAQQRWLDPASGRFLSLDPVDGVVAEPLSTQGFTYAHANPTRFTDPTGEFVPLAIIAAVKIIGAITAAGAVGGAVVGAASTAYVNEDASASDIVTGAGGGALSGAVAGLALGTGIVAAPAAVAAITGTAVSTSAVATGVGVGGVGLAVADAGAKQIVARTAEHRDDALVREANVAAAVATVGVVTLGAAKVNADLNRALATSVDSGLNAVAADSTLASLGRAPAPPRSVTSQGISTREAHLATRGPQLAQQLRMEEMLAAPKPVLFDGRFAARQVLGVDPITPGGRTIMFHAADRMVMRPPGRAKMSMSEVDEVLNSETVIRKIEHSPLGDTITVQNPSMPGQPQVVVDAATGRRVITVVKQAAKGKRSK